MSGENCWNRHCKVKHCHARAYPQSEYCKKHHQLNKTMDDEYGDGSDHKVCEKCGFCIDCGDCAELGCGRKNNEA